MYSNVHVNVKVNLQIDRTKSNGQNEITSFKVNVCK